MSYSARQATRAIAVALLLVAAVAVALILSGRSGGSYELRATFDDVRGLIEGGDVRAGAVSVGKVTNVEIGRDERPQVTMRVDDDFRLHEGAVADLRLASNLGAVNRTIELIQGDESAPRLPDGAHLAVAQTDQPVNLDDAVETLDPRTRQRLGRLLAGLEDSLSNRGSDISKTLRASSPALGETAALLDQVGSDGEALSTLVGDGERVLTAIAAHRTDLGAAVDETATLLGATAARESDLRATVGELAPALGEGRRALEALATAAPKLQRLAIASGPVADEIGPLADVLPDVTTAAAPLLDQTRRLVARGPEYIKELRPIAEAAAPVAAKLEPVARDALPLARVLQVYIPETVGAFQNFGATAGAYDANGHVLNVTSSLVPVLHDSTIAGGETGAAECNPDSPTGIAPGLLEKPFIRVPGLNECQPWTDLPAGILKPVDEKRGARPPGHSVMSGVPLGTPSTKRTP